MTIKEIIKRYIKSLAVSTIIIAGIISLGIDENSLLSRVVFLTVILTSLIYFTSERKENTLERFYLSGGIIKKIEPTSLALAFITLHLAYILNTSESNYISEKTFTIEHYLAFSILATIIPMLEEIFFRGLLIGSTKEGLKTYARMILSSVAFTAFHYSGNPLNAAVMSIILCRIRMTQENILLCIAIHSIANTMLIIYILINRTNLG